MVGESFIVMGKVKIANRTKGREPAAVNGGNVLQDLRISYNAILKYKNGVLRPQNASF